MQAVKPRGSPPPPPPRVARPLASLPYAQTELDVRRLPSDGARPQPPAAPAVTARWAQFEAVGLGPAPELARGRLATLTVAGYRVLGFILLGVIVVVLLGYVATTVFYLVNRTWVVPTIVSPTDERVLALQAELSAQQSQRDRIAAELDEAERAVAAEQRFQLEFANAIRSDLAGRRAALSRMRTLASDAASTRKQIHATNRTYATRHAAQLARQYEAGLLDRGRMLDGKLQISQISGSNLSLAERQAELDTRAAELATAVAGLGAILDGNANERALSYDVLTIKRDYDTSRLALAKALDARTMLMTALQRQQDLVTKLETSAYLRAVRDDATVAVVPYDNAGNVNKGTPLYACRASMVLCRRVGSVLDILPGEVSLRHPHREKQMRGRMLELRLDEPSAARNEVLFLGGAPLWL